MNVITRTDSDYIKDNKQQRLKKVRAQVRFIRHLMELNPQLIIAGGCAYDHLNHVPCKDIDIYFGSDQEREDLMAQLEVISVEDQTVDSDYRAVLPIQSVLMYTVRYRYKGFLINAMVQPELADQEYEERIDRVIRRFTYSDNQMVYYKSKEFGLGIISGAGYNRVFPVNPPSPQAVSKYFQKRLLTSAIGTSYCSYQQAGYRINPPSDDRFAFVNSLFSRITTRDLAGIPEGYITRDPFLCAIGMGSLKNIYYIRKRHNFEISNAKAAIIAAEEQTALRGTVAITSPAGVEVSPVRWVSYGEASSARPLPPNGTSAGVTAQELQPDRGEGTEVARQAAIQRIYSSLTSVFR